MPQIEMKIDTAIRFARWSADALLIPVRVVKGRPAIKPTELGLPANITETVKRLAALYHGRSDTGAIDHAVTGSGTLRRVVIVSLGGGTRISDQSVRTAAASAAAWCARSGLQRVAVLCGGLPESGGIEAWTEGAVLSTFKFDNHKSRKSDSARRRVTAMTLLCDNAKGATNAKRRAERSRIAAEGANLAREIGHEPPNVITPDTLARRAAAEAKRCGLRCTVLNEKKLAELKMNLMLAVGAGSAHPPRLIVLEHKGSGGGKPMVLVGKAITMDTGGYVLKPGGSMLSMKYDKCGGMAVLGALTAAARMKLKQPVIGVIAAAENMVDAKAYRPGDILTAMNGKTVEVIDTDAEGRLVLADALHYACTRLKPGAVIDLATLTGACMVALGHHAAGLFCNDRKLESALRKAGDASGERVWPLPLWNAYGQQLRGGDADLKNSGGRPAGAITAAMFLREFVGEKIPWAHLDIAGMAEANSDSPICPKGATGFGVRLLLRWLADSEA